MHRLRILTIFIPAVNVAARHRKSAKKNHYKSSNNVQVRPELRELGDLQAGRVQTKVIIMQQKITKRYIRKQKIILARI